MFRDLTPVVRALFVLNLVGFGLQGWLGFRFESLAALWPLHADERFGAPPTEVWQLVSYAFLHGGFTHLLMNMFALLMFGPEIERLLGARRFATYYFVCVIGAAVLQLWWLEQFERGFNPTVGASGGIFGLLLAFGLAYPHRKLMLLFPPIPMPAWLFVLLYGLAELLMGVTNVLPGVAHFAHLGGMLGGYLLILYWRHGARATPRRHDD